MNTVCLVENEIPARPSLLCREHCVTQGLREHGYVVREYEKAEKKPETKMKEKKKEKPRRRRRRRRGATQGVGERGETISPY
jgi:hypothetical protein